MAKAAVFDMNETMLDLGSLDAVFTNLFGDAAAKQEWFARLLHTSVVYTATGRYEPFGSLGRYALEATGRSRGITVGDHGWGLLASAMGVLSAHPDVAAGLEILRDDGWTTVTLTNSTQAAAESGLRRNGLEELFDQVISVEAVRRFKPEAAPYRHAAATVGVPMGELWMVAAHDWDLAGAKAVGMRTAFVARPGAVFSPAYPPPDLSGTDITTIAEVLRRG